MSEEIEQKLLREIQELKERLGIEDEQSDKPVYQYSKIRDKDLENLVDIKKNLDKSTFNDWFNYKINIDDDSNIFFKTLIEENIDLVDEYNEEDLKVNVIVPIVNKIKFKSFEKEFRDFYELPIRYEADNFIFNGTTDFVVSKGLVKSEKPYFFIQEFKKEQKDGYPKSQLLAELISGVELNNWLEIKGAYIVGAIWKFVVLKKLDKNRYEYFVSNGFNSMNLYELKKIYKNLLFIKKEILQKLDNETN